MSASSVTPSTAAVVRRLTQRRNAQPHDFLGAHRIEGGQTTGTIIRVWRPSAKSVEVIVGNQKHSTVQEYPGLFTVFLPEVDLPACYRLSITGENGSVTEAEDPYRFLPTIGEMDLYLFNEGKHLRLWEKMGARPLVIDGVQGTAFTVWAPNAAAVGVSGSFNGWNGGLHPMRRLGSSGVFELFIPGVADGALYKYEIVTQTGVVRVKTDPFARKLEQSAGHASIVQAASCFVWSDAEWIQHRQATDAKCEPMLIYEVHLGSWQHAENGRPFSYREMAPRLAEYVVEMGFTHVELMPVQEHPFGGSWGYQVGGYYAPTSRYGTPDDFRFFVDTMHTHGIGVLLDWVPAHFPRDDWALRRFDGTACYEHEDPRLGDHPEWGTHIFNYGRHEVRNFLVANALYWIDEFHIDGLRVDAVASMLYLDYGREAGKWLRNKYGGRENLEAMAFLKQVNNAVQANYPGAITIAEESTSWPRVTTPADQGGLGFSLKWNMGWMHDTLDYFGVDPLFRKSVHEKLTFAMWYEYSERFLNPLSHDEVVHLKRSLLEKMPGDYWKKFANLRALIGYSVTRPGKSLFFMGTELAPSQEWNHDVSLNWSLLDDPRRRGVKDFFQSLNRIYREHSCFWRRDYDPEGFRWIDVADREQSVISYIRSDGSSQAVVIFNLTPVPRTDYRFGVPKGARYQLLLNSDSVAYGGSGYETASEVATEEVPYHGFEQSIRVNLPPLAMLILVPVVEAKLELPEATDTIQIEIAKPEKKSAKRTSARKPKRVRKPKPS